MIDQKPEILDLLKLFVSKLQGFLLLKGTNGTGKTFSAMKIYYYVTPHKLPARDNDLAMFTTQADLNIKWSKDTFNQHILLEELCNTKLLILDDLGTRTPSDAFMDFLYALIDRRWTNREEKATIITTNLDSAELKEKFGKSFRSRISSGIIIKYEGIDRRMPLKRSELPQDQRKNMGDVVW